MCAKITPVKTKWKVSIRKNVLEANWDEELNCRIHYVNFWLLASDGKNHYMHFFFFGENYKRAKAVLDDILASENFTPEGKPKIWFPIVDTREYRPKTWRRLKNWWLEQDRRWK